MNAIIVIGAGQQERLKISLPFIERYAAKIDADLRVIDYVPEYIQRANAKSAYYNYMTFVKFEVRNFVDQYDRILRLDSDVIVRPNCPNIFDEVSKYVIGGVYEDCYSRRKDRKRQMKVLRSNLGKIRWYQGYFNSGVVVTSQMHKDLYDVSDHYLYDKIQNDGLGTFKEQSLLNYRARELKLRVKNIGHKYNHLSLFTQAGFDPMDSYIIHAAGKQKGKTALLAKYAAMYGKIK